jgi:hypothetical protein
MNLTILYTFVFFMAILAGEEDSNDGSRKMHMQYVNIRKSCKELLLEHTLQSYPAWPLQPCK